MENNKMRRAFPIVIVLLTAQFVMACATTPPSNLEVVGLCYERATLARAIKWHADDRESTRAEWIAKKDQSANPEEFEEVVETVFSGFYNTRVEVAEEVFQSCIDEHGLYLSAGTELNACMHIGEMYIAASQSLTAGHHRPRIILEVHNAIREQPMSDFLMERYFLPAIINVSQKGLPNSLDDETKNFFNCMSSTHVPSR
ncbi:hypothetical protein [Alkalilimnicola sp. S0819]|uniref:hypothetical protein n=1 Tax=Alkalilimnicola sp. S0819 TaxID=2613922 RepID=UPI001261CFD6|nr:hypothetical protein [Alkalilimnicola sp. S0819]KAB7619404.1 hypothetical protein F3N43_13860 [Alkalilimnicola sp. S0819]MPQ17719.1 hypothetical protein [Alkalilimnicola sp. S0819]